jgi:hypothetical protein
MSSTNQDRAVTPTQGLMRILIEASGSAVKTEWSGVCIPGAESTISRPRAGTLTTPAGTTSTVLPVQFVWAPASSDGVFLPVPCSVAAYAVLAGHGLVTIKVQDFVG